MSEWLKELLLKSSVLERVPWVRIPPLPFLRSVAQPGPRVWFGSYLSDFLFTSEAQVRRFSVQGFQVGDLVQHSDHRKTQFGLGLVICTDCTDMTMVAFGKLAPEYIRVYWFKSRVTTFHSLRYLKRLEESHK